MKLYPNYETEISFKYLKEVVNILDEPICILGGWAVYFTVNEKIKADRGMGNEKNIEYCPNALQILQ